MIDIAWFGGARSGTDAAKLVGLGVNAIKLRGGGGAERLGARLLQAGMRFAPDRTEEDTRERGGRTSSRPTRGKRRLMVKRLRRARPGCTTSKPEDLRSSDVGATAAATEIVPLMRRHSRAA